MVTVSQHTVFLKHYRHNLNPSYPCTSSVEAVSLENYAIFLTWMIKVGKKTYFINIYLFFFLCNHIYICYYAL